MAAPPLSESELRFLRALRRRKVRFMVVGLSAAALQGAPVVTQDVDLWFEDLSDPGILDALREVRGAYIPPSHLNPPMFAGGGLELFDIVLTMHGLGTFAEEAPKCVEVSLGRQKLRGSGNGPDPGQQAGGEPRCASPRTGFAQFRKLQIG